MIENEPSKYSTDEALMADQTMFQNFLILVMMHEKQGKKIM